MNALIRKTGLARETHPVDTFLRPSRPCRTGRGREAVRPGRAWDADGDAGADRKFGLITSVAVGPPLNDDQRRGGTRKEWVTACRGVRGCDTALPAQRQRRLAADGDQPPHRQEMGTQPASQPMGCYARRDQRIGPLRRPA